MRIAEGATLAAGVGTILGTFVERKKISPLGQGIAYLTGLSLVGFSLYEDWMHKQKRRKWREHQRRRPQLDYSILGGEELPDPNYVEAQKRMTLAQDAGQNMWPEREPIGYLTSVGLEQRNIPGSGLYSYPDNIYDAGRSRIATSRPG